MYWKDMWHFKNSIEYEFKYKGKYGAKGEKRAKRKRATPEQIKIQNQRNREKNVRRLIKANFGENDYWITLKYPKGTRLKIEDVKKHMKKFLDKTRKDYRKRNESFRFMYRMEIGKRGGIHIHILLNRITDADLIIKKNWEQGMTDFTLAYEAGGFRRLAEYLVKPPIDGTDPEGKAARYHPSRNLVRPQRERKEYTHWTVRRLIHEGPTPTPGFYIVPDSIVTGVNPYTGMSYGQAAMKEMSGREKNATRNMLESLALYRALNMLEKPCSVNVFADSGYLAGAVNSKWLENWEKADWKNAHGKPVKNADIWLEVSKCMKQHHVQVLSRKQHKYTGNQEKEIRARIQAEERRDREEEGFLNSLYGLYV